MTEPNASDPYGRTHIPPIPKKPQFFSVTKPFRVLIWAWFWVMDATFRSSWVLIAEEEFFPVVIIMTLLGIGVVDILPVALIAVLVFGITGWWTVLTVFGSFLVHLLIYFAFHLHEKEGRQYWKDKLLS